MNRILKFLLPILTIGAAAMLFGACTQIGTDEEHSWGEWVVVEEPTCEEDGFRSRICTDPGCGASETETLPALKHDYEENVITPPTCTEDGASEFVCKRDPSHRYLETVKALGHDWQETSGYVAPTCTTKGHSVAAFCSRCDAKRENVDLDPLGHDYSGEVTVEEATCETAGKKTIACVRGCGSFKTETLPALGHDYSGEVTIKEATCEAAGSTQKECARCHKTVTEEVPALGHDWNYAGEIQPATCTEPGYSTSAVCNRCHLTQGKTEIPALGHDWNLFYNNDRMPTCMRDGSAIGNCKRCKVRETVVLPKVDHDFSRVVTIKAPTCTEDGEIQYECRFSCGAKKEPEVAPALGHDWKEEKIVKAPTCTQEGSEEHTCQRCQKKETHSIDALGHKFVDTVKTAATDNSTGQKEQVCLFCNAKGETSTVPIPSENVSYEIQLVRSSGLEYIAANEVIYKIYKGNEELQSFGAGTATTTVQLPKDADKLVVTGLRDGFKTDRESYTLDPYSPVVTIKLSAGVRTSTRVETDGKKEDKKPDTLIDEGDPMFDFVVRDTKHINDHSQDQWFSEVIKGKKLVMFDFFWIGCTSCAGLMKQFLQVYNRILQPYKDDILVIMVDVMADETDERINNFVNQYPHEFLTCHGREPNSDFDFFHWFELDSHHASIPMCIFADGEGVVTKIGGFADAEDFENYYTEYFKTYRAPAEKAEFEAAPTAAQETVQETARMPAAFCNGKRKFDL